MENRTVDPWKWGQSTHSVQVVEIKQPTGPLYCSGLVALDAEGQPNAADMRSQFVHTTQNLEQLLREAGYEPQNIVRLNVFTTSIAEFFTTCADAYQAWIARHGIKQATTLVEVKGLFANLTVELEATAVK